MYVLKILKLYVFIQPKHLVAIYNKLFLYLISYHVSNPQQMSLVAIPILNMIQYG